MTCNLLPLRKFCSKFSSLVSQKIIIPILNVNCSSSGQFVKSKKGKLIVANHVSTLDIPLISSCTNTVFVTSMEVRNNAVTGTLALIGGSLFVDRRSLRTLRSDIIKIAGLLSSGMNVAFFPEATSSDGTSVLPFKCALFEAARIADAEIQPLSIQYSNGKKACYYGDMSFFAHMINLISLRKIYAAIHWFEPIRFNNMTSREMAIHCRNLIISHLSQSSPDCNTNVTLADYIYKCKLASN